MGLIDSFHESFVHGRRVDVLASHFSQLIPPGAAVLDVGCGDGWLAAEIGRRRPDVTVTGIDVLKRDRTHVPVYVFDGSAIPFPDQCFDVVLFVDVLHHSVDPLVLLHEAQRVTRNALLIKDHTLNGLFAGFTLRFMDRIGNARHGVALPYNYWTLGQWRTAINDLGLRTAYWNEDLRLYPKPAQWLFDRSLHFIAVLTIAEPD